ncbi:LCP family protein [Paucilactobacillus nenjiangensis]|jgi:LCP family protein required for cell wall assembly|uniref:Transcriptional regulator n=1 Tax=Paucilactobacillus nenjiangensis TaxID=1296540 RepID=A0A5P1X3V1_9LACO|nr:LCP family protein [Paucilactobacillus nenjiangensis]QER67141.1 transcriptional regulator [Paucilactobacillus nenjiangensis]
MNEEDTRTNRHRAPRRKRHWGRWIAIVVGLVLLSVGGYEYYKIHQTAEGIFGKSSAKVSKKLRDGKPVNVLITGVDSGAIGRNKSTYGIGNTDTLEIATVNPKKETITFTSIPRDTLVKLDTDDGDDYVKVNAAYSIGGIKMTKSAIEKLLDIKIDYYANVDMGALEKVVNALGGVTVDNPFEFTYEGHTFPKGSQKLNGSNALKYSRMRYDDPNNDYGRQKRQQQVMKAVVNKFKSASSVTAINKLLDVAKDGLKTDVPINSIATLYANYHNSMNNVKTVQFQGKDATIDGTSFQIASTKEINRVSKLIKKAEGKETTTVSNYATKMYDNQTNFDGYNNVYFVLPDGASYNSPGSGYSSSSTATSSTASIDYSY